MYVLFKLKHDGHVSNRESQLGLLNTVANDKVLLDSRIISSLKPRVGKRFCHKDLEHQKIRILTNARQDLIQKCAWVEAIREIDTLKLRFNKLVYDRKMYVNWQKSISLEQSKFNSENEQKHQKKLKFYHKQMLDRKGLNFEAHGLNQIRKKHREKTQLQKRNKTK